MDVVGGRVAEATNEARRVRARFSLGRALLLAAVALVAGIALRAGVLEGGSTGGAAAVPQRGSEAFVPAGLMRLAPRERETLLASAAASMPGYRIQPDGAGWRATSAPQQLRSHFGAGGVTVSAGGTTLGLQLRSLHAGTRSEVIAATRPHVAGNRVEYTSPAVTQWFQNGPVGLEQGFTVMRAPAATSDGLSLSLALTGNVRARLAPSGKVLVLTRGGRPALRYGGLSATDATGRPLHASMALDGHRLDLRISTHGARFPIRIDPYVQRETLGDGGSEGFGDSFAISGDETVAAIGEPTYNGGRGAVFIFVRSGGAWEEQAVLTPTEEAGAGAFGESVALNAGGDEAVVGAPADAEGAGAVYRFFHAKAGWVQSGEKQGPLHASDRGFGYAVTAGVHVLVSAPDGEIGAVYEILKWEPLTYARVAFGPQSEELGHSVAYWTGGISKAGIVIGAPGGNGLVEIYEYIGSEAVRWQKNFSEEGEEGSQLGYSVAISRQGMTVLAGAPNGGSGGTANVYTRERGDPLHTSWKRQAQLADAEAAGFGSSVALATEGDEALVGAPQAAEGAGKADVFSRTGSSWSLQEGIAAPAGAAGFGSTAALAPGSAEAFVHASSGTPGVDVYAPSPAAPSVAVGAPSGVEKETATLNGTVDPNGSEVTECSFEYHPDSESPPGEQSVPCSSLPGSGTSPVAVSADITGLKPLTAYDYRLIARSAAGETYSSERLFATRARPRVKDVQPSHEGPAGSTVTIRGFEISEATEVRFGEVEATSFEVSNPEVIKAVVPPGTGTVDVTVTTSGGTSEVNTHDLFTYAPAREAPEFGRCLAPGWEPFDSQFKDSKCTKLQNTGGFDWYGLLGSRPAPSHFTLGGPIKLETASKRKLSCTSSSGGGEYTGPKALGAISLRLSGCALSKIGSCTSSGQAEGVIAAEPMVGELGFTSKTAGKVGVELAPASGETVAVFSCAGTAVTLSGAVIGEPKANAIEATQKIRFKMSHGVPAVKQLEGGPEAKLTLTIGAGAPEGAGMKATMNQGNEAEVEISSLV